MSLVPVLNRRSSNQSQGSIPGGGSSACLSNNSLISSSSGSDWPDDASDKESLQSWAKEQQEKEKQAQDEDDMFAAKEVQHLRRWFVVITFAMMIVGICVSVFTYYYLSGEEFENFELAFESTANAIVDSSTYKMKVLERSLLGRSEQLTSFAVFTGSYWPFVSIPDFNVQGKSFLVETEAQMIAWAPLVTTDAKLRAWEAYTTYMLQNSGWFPPTEVDERLKKQLERLEEQAKQRDGDDDNPPNAESGLYAPVWQISPWFYNAWIKHNLTSQFEESVLLLLNSKRPVWTKFLNISMEPERVNLNGTEIDIDADAEESDSIVASFLLQPIFQSLQHHDVSYDRITNTTEDSNNVVGIYLAAIEWETFLDGLVPEGTPGVDLVLRNPWGETLTFEIDKAVEDGPSISFLQGVGDQHASEYDYMALVTNLSTRPVGLLPENNTAVAASTSAVSASISSASAKMEGTDNANPQEIQSPKENAGSGHFQMTIYPTRDFEESYKSDEPLIFTLVMAAVVFFAIAVFFVYSRFVYNRQQRLLETANRTALVVKQLFPSNVRSRIMQEAEESHLKTRAKRLKSQQQRQQLDGSSSERGSVQNGNNSVVAGNSVASAPNFNESRRRLRMPSLEAIRFRGSIIDRRPSGDHKRRASTGSESSRNRDAGLSGSNSQHGLGAENPYGSKPIADHFLATTVLFADMVGFTAWSSVREPTQVFQLLETIYHAFDKSAKKRGIFKVETIGDCYVAVCGLPEPRSDHAVAMAYFANDCLRKMKALTKKLEVSLGPDTADLALRIGLHSGPVTAGVLRGEKSRFQLFGDTVNTTARMESNGKKDCIHISEATANLLVDAGKERWISPREEKIHAKGKGELQTYWLVIRSSSSFMASAGDRRASGDSGTGISDDAADEEFNYDGVSIDDANAVTIEVPDWEAGDDISIDDPKAHVLGDRTKRLVDWNVEQLTILLKKIVASRRDRIESDDDQSKPQGADFDLRTDSEILLEVTEVIRFPEPSVANLIVGATSRNHEEIQLDRAVVSQLHRLITKIASLYGDNPFHSFAHASHVTMALITWLSRIAPPEAKSLEVGGSTDLFALQCDPLTHFAMVFAALIHDLEHGGVPNEQLVKEMSHLATLYNNESIHEQASVDTAFDILMDHRYSDLRSLLFTTEDEFYRFRQVVINGVMATDISNKKVIAKQVVRWGCLFRDDEDDVSISIYEPDNEADQKASIVMERLLVVSNLAHTMQHWYVYRKWNEKMFEESFMAFKAGRATEDPALNWYKNELEFFDTFTIPLATKMKDCGLFDSSVDECVRYAKSNREQWALSGQEEVASMVERLKDLQFEVKDNYNPIKDGRVYSPTNAERPHKRESPKGERQKVDRPKAETPKVKDWKSVLEKFHD